MKPRITKAEARAFKARWKKVNAVQREELRAMSPAQKMRQLTALMASARQLGWTESRDKKVHEVRARWNRLRRIYDV